MYPISCWSCGCLRSFFRLFSSFNFCRLQACRVVFLSVHTTSSVFLMAFMKTVKKLDFDCPLSFSEWSTSTAVRKKILLVSWLPLSLPHLCHHAHSMHPSLLLRPSLSCGFCLSLSYRSCLLSAFVKQYNCNDRQTMARKKPSCLKSCLDPL